VDTRSYDPGTWNVVAVAENGMTGAALRGLSQLASFRTTPYRGVLVGNTDGDASAWLLDSRARRPEAFAEVNRVVPLEHTLAFERDDVTEALCDSLEGAGGRLEGKSFHVRARLRGLKGRLETQAVERALGGFLYERAADSGRAPTVSFDDPDVVVMVQVLGVQVGYVFLDRRLRELDLVRPR